VPSQVRALVAGHLLCEPSIQETPPRRIRHLRGFGVGQVSDFCIGQVTRFDRSASAIASPRLETPSLDRMLLT
jgi:hypothetical protein